MPTMPTCFLSISWFSIQLRTLGYAFSQHIHIQRCIHFIFLRSTFQNPPTCVGQDWRSLHLLQSWLPGPSLHHRAGGACAFLLLIPFPQPPFFLDIPLIFGGYPLQTSQKGDKFLKAWVSKFVFPLPSHLIDSKSWCGIVSWKYFFFRIFKHYFLLFFFF